jgi:hypothetical protein
VAPPEGVEAPLGGLQSAEGIFPSPAQVAAGFICHRGDIDGGEIPGAPQAGQWPGITTVGVHAIARLLRPQ